jgi:ABC-type thiamin/hydroxymethylpyrimidine transport system permease subunit
MASLLLIIGLALIVGGIVFIAALYAQLIPSLVFAYLGYGAFIMVGVGVVLAILGIMLKRKPGKAFGA